VPRVEAVELGDGWCHGIDRDARSREQLCQPRELRRADPHGPLGRLFDELLDAHVRDQLTAPDHDQVLGRQRHLAHQVRGDEHGAALSCECLEQVAHPLDALGIEAVDRLVAARTSAQNKQRSTVL
jgi:hypothetical protein